MTYRDGITIMMGILKVLNKKGSPASSTEIIMQNYPMNWVQYKEKTTILVERKLVIKREGKLAITQEGVHALGIWEQFLQVIGEPTA